LPLTLIIDSRQGTSLATAIVVAIFLCLRAFKLTRFAARVVL